MGKHRKQGNTVRNAVAFAAAGAGLAALAPATATAAPITVPDTDFSVEAPDHIGSSVTLQIDNAHRQAVNKGLVMQAQVPTNVAKKAAPAKASHGSIGQKIADHAMSKVGAPYAWGAPGPNAFDCSGLTSWAHKQVGKYIPRTSQAQAGGGKPVTIKDLLPGDIVCYFVGSCHVDIYIGIGEVVHAVNSGSTVQVKDINYMPVNIAVRFQTFTASRSAAGVSQNADYSGLLVSFS